MRFFIFVFYFFGYFFSFSQQLVDVGMYTNKKIQNFVFAVNSGRYNVYSENGKVIELSLNEMVYVNNMGGGKFSLKSLDTDLGIFKKLTFIGTEYENNFKLKLINPSYEYRVYEDNLKVWPHPYNNHLTLINNIFLDNYISGVVEAEVGKSPPPEYFKLQAIICRTYALNNLTRHSSDGFNLCDEVHCQAYNGKPKSLAIKNAALQTNNIVIVDSDINLITAAFFSNCGGQTCNSEEVWRLPLPYLRAVKDTFCLKENNAVWSKSIALSEWKNYIKSKLPCFEIGNNDSAFFNQQNTERKFLIGTPDCNLTLRQIREDWKLKSAFFTVTLNNEHIEIKGRGFGHGVGLCQEGAMRMSKLGYSYPFILHYYYSGVHMVDLSFLSFFKEE
ncbi:MAG: SpoIID/LytB domain-containing protein [Flavobacteriales bacterium]|nr:SpoIID/LytB domain-containing protein [Flavobacteriales bacterium]